MKTIILTLILLLTTSAMFAGNLNISGNSNTSLGDYKITQISDNLYQLNYSNGESIFIIEICKNPKECCYLIRSDKVELMYLCNEFGFGMRIMPEKYKKLEREVYKQMINTETFSQQSQLTQRHQNKDNALGLIACFFPLTIKSDSYSLVFNYDKTKAKGELSAR